MPPFGNIVCPVPLIPAFCVLAEPNVASLIELNFHSSIAWHHSHLGHFPVPLLRFVDVLLISSLFFHFVPSTVDDSLNFGGSAIKSLPQRERQPETEHVQHSIVNFNHNNDVPTF